MKTAVVTGATSGIGLAAAKVLASRGFRILLVGRSCKRGEAAVLEVGAGAVFFAADLSEMGEVRRLAGEIRAYLAQNCGGSGRSY